MTVRTALVVVAFAVVASTAHAQPPVVPPPAVLHDLEPLAPSLSPAQFAALNLFILPGSNYSAGWDVILSAPVRDGLLARFFYRKIDGLLVGVMEDYLGTVYAQTSAWFIGPNLDHVDLTRIAHADFTPGDLRMATVTVFGYNRTTGVAIRRLLVWSSPVPVDIATEPLSLR
jgi:hypothetical protein